MSMVTSGDTAGHGDILDLMHGQGKQRGERVPEFDAAQMLRLLRAVRDISARNAGPPNFWTDLTPTEQGDLVSAAQKRTFRAGTVLMAEGDPAENVMVILDGRTQIFVHEDGREQVIAERGPGDIIGESGSAPSGTRSAT